MISKLEFAEIWWDKAFENSSKALEFATSNQGNFIFRGREINQTQDGHIDVTMTNYAKSYETSANVKGKKEAIGKPIDLRRKEPNDDFSGRTRMDHPPTSQ